MVYLLCFDRKFKHAKHYIGFAENQRTFEARMKHHSKGSGSRLMAAIAKAGIGFHVSRTWEDGDRNFERKLKNRKKSSQLCPTCVAEKKAAKKALINMQHGNHDTIELMPSPSTMVGEPICPVVKTAGLMCVTTTPLEPAGPSVTELLDKAKEIYAESQSNTNPSRWKRIWSSVARFLRLS